MTLLLIKLRRIIAFLLSIIVIIISVYYKP